MGSGPSYPVVLALDPTRRLYRDEAGERYLWGVYDPKAKEVKYTEVQVEKTEGWNQAFYDSCKCPQYFIEDRDDCYLQRTLMSVYSDPPQLVFWNRSGGVHLDRFTQLHIVSATGVNFFELVIYTF